ncbi:MAG: EAL domain-containing protein [Flexilinea sp.]|nr:EAL domain-containing protein [Flexilinea sp.]
MRFKRKGILTLFILLFLTMLFSLTVYGQDTDQKVVRVGWYESAFHRTDQFGRRSGYGYEYQQRIATFTGWTYEYVEGSWSELLEKLIAGELDLLSDVSYTEERAQKILYSAEGMGSEDFHAFISPDNTEISPNDFSTFNGKRVGVNKNSIQAQLFKDWAENHDVHPEIIELSYKTPELLEMLEQGEIDVLVTLDAYGSTANVIPVCKIGSADSYFGINRQRPDLKVDLDVAMNRILEENRHFNQQLAEKYQDGPGLNGFLTADEVDWLSDHGTIRVGYRAGYLPFCEFDTETQSLTGALADFLRFAETAEKNAKMSFEAKAFYNTEDALQALANGEIDCMFPVNLSAYDGEKLGVIITDTFVSTEMYAAMRTDDHRGISRDQNMTVAVIQGSPNYETFLMDNFPEWKLAYYQDSTTGYEAVASGKADCALVSNYRLNLMNELYMKYKLSAFATGETMDLSFAVRRDDDCLYSIINKISHLMPDTAINSSLTYYSKTETHTSFSEFIRDNLRDVFIVITAIFLIIVFLLLASLRAEKRANKGQQLISATETDNLTGLYNRNFFYEYANRMYHEHPENPMDAFVLNIEQFHSVNALNGRNFGDHVLSVLGNEIKTYLDGTEGIAGRIEADRFDIYCRHTDAYRELYDQLQNKMEELSHNANIRLRMGVMPWQKDMEPFQQFDQAHTACNLARGHYKKRLIIFDEKVRKREIFEQHLQNDLRRALDNHEFEVYYQPKYNIQGEAPVLKSAEALIRWRHPEFGMIGPEAFIPMFERNGQISSVDKYVWEEAAQQIRVWKEKYGFILPLSVNLSRVDVFDPTLEKTLDDLLLKNGLDPSALTLEVTESAYTENADQLIRVIKGLREKGYKIEMDDFGSGYSSLNMISSMPIDILKMDRGFIQRIEHSEKDVRLVELILNIAKNLKVPVIAEGVETAGQLQILKEYGCAMVQGFYFSRPLPADQFEENILITLANNEA